MKFEKINFLTIIILGLIIANGFPQESGKMTPRLQHRLAGASEGTIHAVWIYFSDKGPNTEQRLSETEQALLPKALARRSRQPFANQRLVDGYDLPLHQDYLTVVKNLVLRIRQKSRWMNALSAEVTSAGIEQLIKLPFIRKIDTVFITTAPLLITDSHNAMDPASSISNTEQLNYG